MRETRGVPRSLTLLALTVLVLTAATVAVAGGRPDVKRWPSKASIVLIQNDSDQSRPLDGRTGYSPFDGKASWTECNKRCKRYLVPCAGEKCTRGDRMWDGKQRHLKLLGGHGNDDIHGSPGADVLWGDFKPSGQPSSQVDKIDGGAGSDFIYTSHGRNIVQGGSGNDYIVARFSRGTIDCGPGKDIVFVSKKSQRATTFKHCETITRGGLR
jgi:Ca2+-binding RTX toxin-like protein